MELPLPCSGVVTLLTDFGIATGYAAAMKGVMLGINPMLRIVDVTHAVSPHTVKEAAFVLLSYYQSFPRGSVHLVVVDPGVGSSRRPIAVETRSYFFVGPENGVLDMALSREKVVKAVVLDNECLGERKLSSTFHGRDLFSPAAAWLASGRNIEELGDLVSDFSPASFPQPVETGFGIEGEVLYIDSFGNAITNIDSDRVGREQLKEAVFSLNGVCIEGIVSYYGVVERGACLALEGSTGFIEIGLREENFSAKYNVSVGDPIEVRWKER